MSRNTEFFTRIESQPDFKVLHAPIAPSTRLVPSEYVIRDDGTLVFLEAIFTDPDGSEHLIGNPVRFPKLPGSDFKVGKIDRIFGVEFHNIMKILAGGKMSDSHHTQVEAIQKIIAAQADTPYAIRPFRPTPLHLGSRFERGEFVWHFPMDKTLAYFLDRNVENVVAAVRWAERETGLKISDLGLTGSSSVGIIDPKEDVDLCFMAPVKRLTEIRDMVRDGVKEGRYTPMEEFGHVWPLRVKTEEFELCPFWVPSDYEMDGACLEVLGPLPDQEVTVVGDERNMLSPVMLTVADAKGREHEMVITTGFNRGHYFNGDRLRLRGAGRVRVKSRLRTFEAILLKTWNAATIVK